jgi:hypothetical protein
LSDVFTEAGVFTKKHRHALRATLASDLLTEGVAFERVTVPGAGLEPARPFRARRF